jgi:flagellar biosynthesis protein FliP
VKRLLPIAAGLACVLLPLVASAQSVPGLSINLTSAEGPEQVVPTIKILLMLTVLSLAPAILMTMTSFTRIVVVLSFVRQAVGTQNVPPQQVIVALSLLLTGVVMAPVGSRIAAEAMDPYTRHEIDETQAYTKTKAVISDFMLRQTRESDLSLMVELSQAERPAHPDDLSLHLLVPAFLLSELRTGFEMGFLLLLPFLLIDLVVASSLTSLGMVMVPPTMVSAPLKLLLFVVVDGWALLTRSLVLSFS